MTRITRMTGIKFYKTSIGSLLSSLYCSNRYKKTNYLLFLGNSLTIFVMLRKPFRQMSVSVVLISLSISDTIVSLMLPFNKMFVRNMIGYDMRALSLTGCKIYFWALKAFKVLIYFLKPFSLYFWNIYFLHYLLHYFLCLLLQEYFWALNAFKVLIHFQNLSANGHFDKNLQNYEREIIQ